MKGGEERLGRLAAEDVDRSERCARIVVDCGLRIHRALGPGLLESVYESVLERDLRRRGLSVDRQKSVPFQFEGMHFDEGLRVDLLVEGVLVVELKCVEVLAAAHIRQVVTYLRLSNLSLGILLNFSSTTFREGCRRVALRDGR